jgi:hypothetical protein
MHFFEHQSDLKTAVSAEYPFSLFGAAVLWSGWSTDNQWLRRELLVLLSHKQLQFILYERSPDA